MKAFGTKSLPVWVNEVAPDGSEVKVLLGLKKGLMGYHELTRGHTSTAIMNRTAEAIRFFVSGRGTLLMVWPTLLLPDNYKQLAIENYKKCLELNPNNTNAVEMLKHLGKSNNHGL